MSFIKKIISFFLLLLVAAGCFFAFPFGRWSAFDFFRFDAYSATIQLSSHFLPDYHQSSLQEKIKTPPAWMTKQIQEDLRPHGPVTAGELQHTVEQIPLEQRLSEHLLVTVIIDETGVRTVPEKLLAFDGRRRSVVEALQILHKQNLLPPCQFLLSIADKLELPHARVPVFAFSKDLSRPQQRGLVLLPDGMNLCRWSSIQKTIRYANHAYPWTSKKDIIFWRGSNTNPSRVTLCDLSRSLPYLDAKITAGRNSVYEIPEAQIAFKYLISMDGVTSTWPGLLWKLASNSLVIKQDSPHIQWYYQALKPHVHYVPVTHDLRNLGDVYHYAQTHDSEMQTITRTAHEFVENNLQYEDMLVYLALVIQTYAAHVYRT